MDLKKIFISYSHEDKEFVKHIATQLRNNGLNVTIDEWELNAGDRLYEKIIQECLCKSDIIVAIISQSSLDSNWVKEELNISNVMRLNGKVKLIPIHIDDSNLPDWIKSIYYIPFHNSSFNDDLKRLIKHIYGKLDKPELGSSPDYIDQLSGSYNGLSKDATIVARYIISDSVKDDGEENNYNGEDIQKIINLDVSDINYIVDELENEGYIRVFRYLGTAPYTFHDIEPTYNLYYDLKKLGLDYDPNDDIKSILNIVNQNQSTFGSNLSNNLKIPTIRINRAIEFIADHDLAKIIRADGTHSYHFYEIKKTFETKKFIENM